jgi:hypothetical protein
MNVLVRSCLVAACFVIPGVYAGIMGPASQFTVGESGAATYSIAIDVPPGVGGMEPKLGFAYSSQAGNALLGVGWNLSGMSAITRCPRTPAQDGIRSGVAFTLNDRYCLDGQRLIAISGSNGANLTEYRTERESFTKVTSFGVAGNGPAYFVLRTKDGLVKEYGNTADSRAEAVGLSTVRTWALNKITDSKGNYLSVSYTEGSDGTHLPSSVQYGGNVNTGLAHSMYVTIVYESRPDKLRGYFGGTPYVSSQRILRVDTYISGAPVKSYRASYFPPTASATGRSLLYEISECDAVGACRLALRNGYSTLANQFLSQTWAVASLWGPSGFYWTGDFNGDGKTDIASALNGNVYMKLSTGSGFTSQTWPVAATWNSAPYTWTGDFNGDGKTDIASAEGANVYMKLSTGSGFTSQTWPVTANWGSTGYYWVGDFNGDGRSDIASAVGTNVYMKLSTGTGFTSQTWTVANAWGSAGFTWVGDFNGDGLADIATAIGGNVHLKLSTGTGFTSVTWPVADLWGCTECTFVGDFNGDGLTDIASASGGNVYVKLSTGTGFVSETWPVSNVWGPSAWYRIADVNGDGRSDIISPSMGTVYVKLSTGTGFTSETRTVANAWGEGQYTWVGDFNGDGRADLASASGANVYMKIGDSSSDSVTSLLDGLGVSRIVTYKTLPQTLGQSYIKTVSPSYPRASTVPALQVVTDVLVSNGLGVGGRQTSYSYGDLEIDLSGRGSQGFRWQQTLDVSSGLRGRTFYRQDFPFTGLVDQESTGQAGQYNNLKLNTRTYKCSDYVSSSGCALSPGRRYFVSPDAVDERAWDVNGTAMPIVVTTQVTDPSFGDVTSTTRTVKNPDGSATGYTTTTTNEYAPADQINWYLGRLLRSRVTNTTP